MRNYELKSSIGYYNILAYLYINLLAVRSPLISRAG